MPANLYPSASQDLGFNAGSLLADQLDLTEEERKKRLLGLGRDALAQTGPAGMGLAATNLLGVFRG